MENNKIEITRSYSRKVNIGNYQTQDFFCSAKKEVLEKEVAKHSEDLCCLCVDEVNKSIKAHREDVPKTPVKPIPKKIIKEEQGAEIMAEESFKAQEKEDVEALPLTVE